MITSGMLEQWRVVSVPCWYFLFFFSLLFYLIFNIMASMVMMCCVFYGTECSSEKVHVIHRLCSHWFVDCTLNGIGLKIETSFCD